jgi:hypothetical protein
MIYSRQIWVSACGIAVFVAAITDACVSIADDEVLTLNPTASAVFADAVIPYSIVVEGVGNRAALLGWTFAISGRTVASGEVDVAAGNVRISLPVPPLKAGVTLDSILHLVAQIDGKENAVADKQITIFPKDAFSPLRSIAERVGVAVYDPSKTTTEILRQSGLPLMILRSLEAIESTEAQLVLVGEGLAADRYTALPKVMANAASNGKCVVCLPATSGHWQIPELSGDVPRVHSVSLCREEGIRSLDKQFNIAGWADSAEIVSGGILIEARGKSLQGKVTTGPAAWRWIEIDYVGGGKVIYCGYRLIGAWESNPTPRYVLARLLERMPLPEPAK